MVDGGSVVSQDVNIETASATTKECGSPASPASSVEKETHPDLQATVCWTANNHVDFDDPDASKNKNPFLFLRKRDIPLLVLALVANALSAGTHVAVTIMLNRLFNKLAEFQQHHKTVPQFISELRWACFSIALVGLGAWLFGWLETSFFSYLGERQQVRCRRMLYRSLVARNYSWFETNSGLDGDLVQLNRSVEEYRAALSEYLSILCKSVFLLVALSITSFIYSWRLTLLVLASFPIMSLVIVVFGRPVEKAAKKEDDNTATAISHIDWNLLSFVWVKMVHSKHLEKSKMKSVLDSGEASYRRFATFSTMIGSLISILSLMMFVQCFWFGSWLIRKEYNKPGDVVASFYACLTISITITSLSALTVVFQKANASFTKVMRFMLNTELERNDHDHHVEKSGKVLAFNLDGQIVFNNVSFAYSARKNTQVLSNVSFNIPKNAMSFIIGKSGSGKSTLSSLISKLYKPDSGNITVDGYDLSYLDDCYLRDQITLVQQFPTIFNETLRTNLAYGTSIAEEDTASLLKAVTMFNLNELVDSLPNGLDTVLGAGQEDIIQLSGGQEQRLNLARARLRDSPILILDESLSAVDIQQRNVLMERIRDWRVGKTTIIITHELSQINSEDNVILIEYGRITETGVWSRYQHLDFQEVLDVPYQTEKETFSIIEGGEFDSKLSDATIISLTKEHDLESQHTSHTEEKDHDLKNVKGPMLIAFSQVMQLMPLKYKVVYAFGIALSIGSAILSTIFSFFISKLINGIIPKSMGGLMSTNEQLKWAMAATGIAIGQGVLQFLSSIMTDFAAERFCKVLRLTTFQKMLNQDMLYFESAKANEISTLVMNDMRDYRNVVAGTLSHILSGIAIAIVCIAWTLSIGWKFALVGFSLFPLFALFSTGCTFLMQGFEFNYKEKLNGLEELIHDTRVGIKTILCLNLKPTFLNHFEMKLTSVLRLGRSRAMAMGFVSNVSAFISNLAQAILYYYGLKLVATGEYTLVSMTQIVMMITMSTGYIAHIMSGAPGIYRGLRVAVRLNHILQMDDDANELEGHNTPHFESLEEPTAFKFNNVSFAYPSAPQRLIFDHINLTIPSKTMLSLVGESGCGKSTIISLMLRIYALEEAVGGAADNTLLFNGYDINSIQLAHLRSTIAVVSQKHFFFNGTFRENLLYGHPRPETINDAKIMHVLEKLDLWNLVHNLPKGLDSNLSVSQQLLVSGGQAQRLSLARAILRDATVLILDECTSSLDTPTATRVLDLLDELKKEKTIICITHNREVMMRSDIICYLKEGQVVEQGTYQTLMDKQSYFYNMVKTIA